MHYKLSTASLAVPYESTSLSGISYYRRPQSLGKGKGKGKGVPVLF
jgi:hypothetical protein